MQAPIEAPWLIGPIGAEAPVLRLPLRCSCRKPEAAQSFEGLGSWAFIGFAFILRLKYALQSPNARSGAKYVARKLRPNFEGYEFSWRGVKGIDNPFLTMEQEYVAFHMFAKWFYHVCWRLMTACAAHCTYARFPENRINVCPFLCYRQPGGRWNATTRPLLGVASSKCC